MNKKGSQEPEWLFEMVITLLVYACTGDSGGIVINTAYIERLSVTFRQRLDCLVRRADAPWLVRSKRCTWTCFCSAASATYCTHHKSLHLKLWSTERRIHWVQRTLAMAAGLSDHCWSVAELMAKLPISPFVPPRRDRPPKQALAAVLT